MDLTIELKIRQLVTAKMQRDKLAAQDFADATARARESYELTLSYSQTEYVIGLLAIEKEYLTSVE